MIAQMTRPLSVALVFLAACAAARADEKSVKWSTIRTDYYDLHYHPDRTKDAKKVQGFLDAARAAFKKEFADLPVDDLLRVSCQIYLHPAPSAKASESMANITTGRDSGRYLAIIDLLTPSAYGPKYRNNVGQPMDDDAYNKLIVHEYSTILLDRITQSKKEGWSFFTAPRWFIDGYEEYLGLMHSSPRNRKETLARYLALHKDDRDRIDLDFGVSVKDPYLDGAVLLLFLHESFGKKRVQAILTSKERRFGKAVTSALGVSLTEFTQRWEAWIEKKRKS